MSIEVEINQLPVSKLLELGEKICSTDYAVKFYNNEHHPQFFGNREALVHAIRRSYAMGSRSTKEKIEEFLEASPKTENSEQYITLSTVKDRGWTETMLKKLSVQPDKFATNPYYKNASQMKLYSLARIKEIENTQQFNELYKKSQMRRESAQKAVNTKTNNLLTYVNSIPLRVEYMPDPELTQAAIDSYNTWQKNRPSVQNGSNEPFTASESSDSAFLARIRLNFIRHNLTNYDEILEEIRGKTGVKEVYPMLKSMVQTRIKVAWVQQSVL